MPLPQMIAEAVGQLVMEAGHEVIKQRYGWIGCVVALVILVAIVVIAWWYFAR